MHVGRTSGPALARPMLDLDGRPDGAVSPDGRIMGCYVHGLFAGRLPPCVPGTPAGADAIGLQVRAADRATLDALADYLETHVHLDGLLALARSRAV